MTRNGPVIDFLVARSGGRSGLTGSRCGCPGLAAACRSTTTPFAASSEQTEPRSSTPGR